MRTSPLLLVLFALGCGGAPAPSVSQRASTMRAPEGRLDWALLLPIETEGIVRMDLARMRRSPHHAALTPVLDDLLSEVDDAGMRQGLAALLARTNLVLVALLPHDAQGEEQIVILARGDYRPDELEQLNASSSAPNESMIVDVAGHRVWVDRSGEDRTAVTQLRADTLALTGTVQEMQALLARTRMRSAPRWPPSVRSLIEATELERSMFGLALANRDFGGDEDEPLTMSLAGRADADGPLDIDVLVEVGDPQLALMAAAFFSSILEEMARSAGANNPPLRRLAELARIEPRGTQIHGTIHAERGVADELVPSLMSLLRTELASEPAPETPSMPAATPL